MKKIILAILILILLGIFIICNFINPNAAKKEILLSPLAEFNLSVPEPSGLYFDKKSNTLWTVSDENSSIYNINLTGEVLRRIVVNGIDLEGITMMNDSTLITILERDRIVVFLNKSGTELKRLKINLSGKLNNGLEGIAFNKASAHLYLLNEKDPGMLLEVDTSGNIIKQNKLNYASDYSGLFFDDKSDELWIISDEEKAIFRCTLDGILLEKFKVDVKQIEGIAIDRENSLIYLVSDPLEKLFVYSLP